MKGRRVRLLANLTGYDSRCVLGSLGTTCPDARAQWGVMVRYDNGAFLDTLGQSLEDIDDACPGPEDPEGYLRWRDARYGRAEKITVYVGPYGGFRSLTHRIDGAGFETYDKQRADELLDVFMALGKEVEERWPDGTTTQPDEDAGRTPLRRAQARLAAKPVARA